MKWIDQARDLSLERSQHFLIRYMYENRITCRLFI